MAGMRVGQGLGEKGPFRAKREPWGGEPILLVK